jgi:hypothetical protein
METVYVFIVFVFSTAFGVPIIQWFYHRYVVRIIESASEAAAAAKKRTTERVSAAGRRVTTNRLSGKIKT